jgi:hypothetical protein
MREVDPRKRKGRQEDLAGVVRVAVIVLFVESAELAAYITIYIQNKYL